MKILVSGATGLIGAELVRVLEKDNEVGRLVRRATGGDLISGTPRGGGVCQKNDVLWDLGTGVLQGRWLDGVDVVVHLAGENIGAGRWTKARQEIIRNSRVVGTAGLVRSLAHLARPPVFLCASAVGYYGHRGDEILTEASSAGSGFLAEVCRSWEESCRPLVDRGGRVVNLRFGPVLSERGGVLAKMKRPFLWGLGGKIGRGHHYMSWVSLSDAVGAILYAMDSKTLSGPVNVTAPHPVTNKEFTQALGKALRRPTVLSVPAFITRMVFGKMADELILSSARALPQKLLKEGYVFKEPFLERFLKKRSALQYCSESL